jgi:hypothetical protein
MRSISDAEVLIPVLHRSFSLGNIIGPTAFLFHASPRWSCLIFVFMFSETGRLSFSDHGFEHLNESHAHDEY